MTEPNFSIRDYSRLLRLVDIGRHFDTALPRELRGDYQIPPEAWRGMARRPQKKYLNRKKNLKRAFNRVNLFLPELLNGKQKEVFELSTAHGAILEVLRHFGHDVLGNDYVNMVSGDTRKERAIYRTLNDPDFARTHDDYGLPVGADDGPIAWPYKPIIDSIGIPMKLFDAGITPYPFADKSFDYVLSMQAIEHYCHPKDWMKIIDEMCRISREAVFLLLNPLMPEMAGDLEYSTAFHSARHALRNYDHNGFRCIGCHLHWGQALGFKLMRI